MNILDIIKKTGSSIIRNVIPAGGVVLDVINEFLPNDKKLNDKATGEDIHQAIMSLPPETQAQILAKKFDVEIAEINSWTDIQASLSEADKAGASTRPFIAKLMALVVAFAVIIFIVVFAYAIKENKLDTIKVLNDSWPLLLTVLGTPSALLRAYFGLRSREKETRYNLAAGKSPINGMSKLINLFKG